MIIWLKTYPEPTVTLRTYEDYEEKNRLYITPLLGHIPLQSLTSTDIQQAITALARRGLSRRTVQYALVVLRMALKKAVEDPHRLIHSNPATSSIKIPTWCKVSEPKIALTMEEVNVLLIALADDPLTSIAVRVLVGTGVRAGELLPMRWANVDLVRESIFVREAQTRTKAEGLQLKSTKNTYSLREIPMYPGLANDLRAWRKIQLEWKMFMGSDWVGDTSRVFTMPDGQAVREEFFGHQIHRALAGTGIYCTPLILRKTFVSLLMENHCDLKTLQELCGHSTPRMILEKYANSNLKTKRRAVEVFVFDLDQQDQEQKLIRGFD